jgi:8-oxo-dGTP pyrophosphatase MutT (NUDIX family)
MDKTNPWQTLQSKVVYDNPWILVRQDDVVRPDGEPGIYGVVHYKNKAIGILPIDDEGYVHLVGQYRYTLNCYSWEIPEGGCPEGEDPLEGAKRELLEETGLQAQEWRLLGKAHLSNSVSDEEALWFLATKLTQGEAQPDGTEKIMHKRVPFQEALRMVAAGEITDALAIIAIQSYALQHSQLKLPLLVD